MVTGTKETHTHTHREEIWGKTEEEIGVMCLQVKDGQVSLAVTRSWKVPHTHHLWYFVMAALKKIIHKIFIHLSVPQFSHIQSDSDNNIYLLGFRED